MRTNSLALSCATLALTAGAAWAAPEPASIPILDHLEDSTLKHADISGSANSANQLLKHQRNEARIAAAAAGGGAGHVQSRDEGDIAILVDDGIIVTPARPANLYDLAAGTSISYAPGVDSFSVSSGGAALDPGVGGALPLGDDDTTVVNFPGGFPFLGTVYTDINVNSDGNITLGDGNGDGSSSARTAGALISGAPRIAPLYVDLDVTSGGSINADVRGDRIVVTWTGVPQFGIADANTFQVVLHSSGIVDMVHDSIQATVAVVGLAEGASEGPFNEVDLSADLPGTFDAGAVFEEFQPGLAMPSVDTLAAAQAFYDTHDDKFDIIVFFTDFVSDLGGGFAFHQGLQNHTEGIGFQRNGASARFDFSALAGSDGELESLLHMNRIGLYWPNGDKLVNPPIKMFRTAALKSAPGSEQLSIRARWAGTLNGDFGAHGSYTLGLNSAMSIMGQEAGHRWLAFEAILPPAPDAGFFDLLGRAAAHWSFFFNVEVPASYFPDGDPRASSAEGNVIRELGADPQCPGQTLFETHPNELVDGYTLLDQYIMGLRPASDVPPMWYIKNPTIISPAGALLGLNSASGARDDILICGDRQDILLSDITNLGIAFGLPSNGPREVFDRVTGLSLGNIPGDEIDMDANGNPADDVKTMAFVLITESDNGVNNGSVNQIDTFRQTAEDYLNGAATGGLGRFDTSLDPAVH